MSSRETVEKARPVAARRVGQRSAKTHGLEFAQQPMDEVMDHLDGILRAMSGDGMFEYEWETVVTKSDSPRMPRAAHCLGGYECPCTGVTVRDTCVECRRT